MNLKNYTKSAENVLFFKHSREKMLEILNLLHNGHISEKQYLVILFSQNIYFCTKLINLLSSKQGSLKHFLGFLNFEYKTTTNLY